MRLFILLPILICSGCQIIKGVQESTQAIECNRNAIERSTLVVCNNSGAIEKSTESICVSQENIDRSNKALIKSTKLLEETGDVLNKNLMAMSDIHDKLSPYTGHIDLTIRLIQGLIITSITLLLLFILKMLVRFRGL